MLAFPSMRPLLMAGKGYFRDSSAAKERAKVKVHVERGGSVNLAKKTSQQQSALRRDFVMLATCLKNYQEVIRDSLA